MPREKSERWTWMDILSKSNTGFLALASAYRITDILAHRATLITVMKYGNDSNQVINKTFGGEAPLGWLEAPGS